MRWIPVTSTGMTTVRAEGPIVRYSIFSILSQALQGQHRLEAGLARRGAQAGLRRRHRRRRRAWAGDGVLSRQGARHHQRRRAGEGLARQRQRRAQHHHHPLQLSAARQHPLLRMVDEAVGGAGAGPQLQRHGEPARRAQPLSLRRPARRLRPARQRHAAQRRRCRAARPRAGAGHCALSRFRQRPLPDPGRPDAAARRHRAPRRGGLGLCAGGRPARRRHRAELRGHRHPRRRRARRSASTRPRASCAPARSASPAPATPRASPPWRACGCRSRATCCRPSCRKASSR